uniref:PCIF1 WW domain-containing protein n=1 Tax=viral metagenome TaxID=1070528 RepID=A0A6C0C6U4_9ZZZZ
MYLSKKYKLETIRIKYWHVFLAKCVTEMTKILLNSNAEIQKYKLEQKILNYNTYIIGKCDLSSYVIFPKKICIIKYQSAFKDDILHNWQMSDDDFHVILEIFVLINHSCKRSIKKEVAEIDDSELEVTISQKDNVELVIDSKKFKISKKHFTRLQKIFTGDKKDINIMICILLTRYEYYGVMKEGICLSADDVYQFIFDNKLENDTLEAFAGTLNSNLPNYCSLFYDIEKIFGSKGSFLNMQLDTCNYEIIISNPPYITNVMDDSSDKLINFLELCNGFVIVVIPDWRSVAEYDADVNGQISINEHEQKRETVPYNNYAVLRNSNFFRNVICIGDYMYYNFFANSQKKIRDNVLFVILSSDKGNDLDKKFIDYMKQKIS